MATTPTKTTPSASVKATQTALNAKGANLKVDGIQGPLTNAAIAKYGTTSSSGSASAPKTATFGDKGQYTYNVDSKGTPYGNPINTTSTVAPESQTGTTPKIDTYVPPALDTTGIMAGAVNANLSYNDVLKQNEVNKNDTQSRIDKLFADIPSAEANMKSAREVSGLDTAQKIANEENAKLQTIIKQGQANQLSVVGQGRGIPEAIIGGQQAQFARETAIQALPVQASLEAATGNLAAATATFDKLFTAKQQDAQNKLQYGMKMIDTLSQYADKDTQIKLDYVKQQEQRKYDESTKNNTAINALLTKSAEFGVTSDVATKVSNLDMTKPDSVAQAALLLSPFLSKAGRELKTVGDTLYMYDKNTNRVTLVGGQNPGASGVNVANPEYKAILTTILGSGKFTKDQTTQITNSINNGEDPLTVVKNRAKDIMQSTDATILTKTERARASMLELDKQLKEYYKNGGKTNIFDGNIEQVAGKLGTVKDEKLREIATAIETSLQTYRNAVSGTAYSVQEGTAISAIFPNIKNTKALNNAIVSSRLNSMDKDIDAQYSSTLGSKAYQNLKEVELAKNNIPKGTLDDKSYVEKVLTSQNIKYDEFVNSTPKDQIPVIFNSTGEIGNIPISEYLLNKIKMPDGSYKSVADFTKI